MIAHIFRQTLSGGDITSLNLHILDENVARKRIHYLRENGIEKSIPRNHRLSSRGIPRDDKR